MIYIGYGDAEVGLMLYAWEALGSKERADGGPFVPVEGRVGEIHGISEGRRRGRKEGGSQRGKVDVACELLDIADVAAGLLKQGLGGSGSPVGAVAEFACCRIAELALGLAA